MRRSLWPEDADDFSEDINAYFNGRAFGITVCFVAVRPSGGLGGFLELDIRNYAEGSRESRVAYVEGWYVDLDLRGHGFGAALMDAAEAWALEHGLSELASDTGLDNQGSIAAHRSLGFAETDRMVCFLKKLDN